MSNKDIKDVKQFIDLLNILALSSKPISSCPIHISKKDKTMLLKGGQPGHDDVKTVIEAVGNGTKLLSNVPNVNENKYNYNAINACSTTNYNIAELNSSYALAGTLLQNGVNAKDVMEFAMLLSDKQLANKLELAKIEQQTKLAIAEKEQITELAETYYNQKLTTIGFLGGSIISAGLGALTYNGATNILTPITGLLGHAINSGDVLKKFDAATISKYITDSGIQVPWGTETIFSTIVYYLSTIIVLLLNGCLNTAGALITEFSQYLKTIAETGVTGASIAVFCFSIIMTFFITVIISKSMTLESIKLSPFGPEINFSRKERKTKKQTMLIEEIKGGNRKKYYKPKKTLKNRKS